MFTNEGYALLIGVDDYSAFDRSSKQTIGTSDLKGSRNDVRAFWRLCRLIGMKPANLRVLTSPPIDFHELEGASSENVGPATEAEINKGVSWLAGNLGHASRPSGVLTYSGHGDWLADKGLVLCPTDVASIAGGSTGGDLSLDHAVAFSAINAVLARHDAAENLTVVLDTCHSGGTDAGRRPQNRKTGHPLSLTARPASTISEALQARKDAATPEPLSGRVLAAAGRDQVAYQSMFDGHFRGVFSWALAAALEQWRPVQEAHNVRVNLSYDKLIETAQRLITALWFQQTPELHGPPGLGALAVFHQGIYGHPGETKDLPDGGFKTEQLDPGFRNYLLYDLTQAGVSIGQVLVTGATAGAGFDAEREYWYLTSNVSMSSPLTFTSGASQAWTTVPTVGTLSFKTQRRPSWTSATPRGDFLLETNALTGERTGINWQMTVSGGVWSGSIVWWHSTTGNLFGPSQTNTLTLGTPAAGTWYHFSTSPL